VIVFEVVATLGGAATATLGCVAVSTLGAVGTGDGAPGWADMIAVTFRSSTMSVTTLKLCQIVLKCMI
jgi:hypothetical protein